MSRERDADPAGRARPTREELEASQKALLESEARLREMNAELERHVAERTAALQASEARLRTIFETSYQYQGLLALDGTLLEANAASLEGIEAAVSDVVGKPFWDTPWFTGTPGMPTKVREAVALVASGQIVRQELLLDLPTGQRAFDFSMRPICNESGSVVAIVPEAVEITKRRQAEAELRQAQKMEALGQLTGGIAHDFNNMLQGIGSSLELMQRRIEQGRTAEGARFAQAAGEMVERAAALTHRLLAFARRQALQPVPVEPDALIKNMAELIQRTVGPGITVELRMGDGIWTVLCDPNQLESMLLNLAINARDAMPEGGRLTIATEDVHLGAVDVAEQEGAAPGKYVEISVADTGIGMDEATRARAFEPFFTTKPLGQGTGLGLSQAYGFVRQSNGVLRLESTPGRGTVVRLYLPRHAPVQAPQAGEHLVGVPAEAAGTGVTVLLVEDEVGVRTMASEHLRELGYAVLEAANGSEALRVLHDSRGAHVDMLVTDVGLPGGLNGRQVADMARQRLPSLPVLFITGYTGGAIESALPAGMAMIGKPFTLDMLATRVRSMIEGQDQPNSENSSKGA